MGRVIEIHVGISKGILIENIDTAPSGARTKRKPRVSKPIQTIITWPNAAMAARVRKNLMKGRSEAFPAGGAKKRVKIVPTVRSAAMGRKIRIAASKDGEMGNVRRNRRCWAMGKISIIRI